MAAEIKKSMLLSKALSFEKDYLYPEYKCVIVYSLMAA